MQTPIYNIEVFKKNVSLNLNALKNLPRSFILAYVIQYKKIAEKLKEILSKSHNIISFRQVLGCSSLSEQEKNVPILLIADGKFHALNLAIQSNSPIYIYNGRNLEQFDQKEKQKLKSKQSAKLAGFLLANNMGLLCSLKHGQYHLAQAIELKKSIENMKKSCFIFVADSFNLSELENFSIDFWINTACKGLAYDSPKILNYEDLSSLKLKK